MKKKLLALGLSAVMVLANGSFVYAEEYSASPRWVACGNCEDGGLVEVDKHRVGTGIYNEVNCTHGHHNTVDHIHKWDVRIFVECNRCHARTWYEGIEQETVCQYLKLGCSCVGKLEKE